MANSLSPSHITLPKKIKHVAVIGSGIMGGGIAALLAGCGLQVSLLDIVPNQLTEAEKLAGLSLKDNVVRNRIVNHGLNFQLKSTPPAFFDKIDADVITLGNLDDNLDLLKTADWVIEVVFENLEIKHQVYAKIIPHLRNDIIITSNTSGLPIAELIKHSPEHIKARFLGTHFFNPPRYLPLLELIPTQHTHPDVTNYISLFCQQHLGKEVIIAKDTPNFIANRVGTGILGYRISYAIENNYTIEEVDAMAGRLMGAPNTAVFRLNDLVGLDIGIAVNDTLQKRLPNDPAILNYTGKKTQQTYATMLKNKWLGNKTKIGFYKTVIDKQGKKSFLTLDFATLTHQTAKPVNIPSLKTVGKIRDLGDRLRAWIDIDDRGGNYVWHTTAYMFSYAAQVMPDISKDLHSIDRAMRFGFMLAAGPFEIWDMLGVKSSLPRMQKDGYKVPNWIHKMLADGKRTFYKTKAGKRYQYDPNTGDYQEIPPLKNSININLLKNTKHEIITNPEAGLFDLGDQVLLFELHGKGNAISETALDTLAEAANLLETGKYNALVIGNQGAMFSGGLKLDPGAFMSADKTPAEFLNQSVKRWHDLFTRLRYLDNPVVTAPFNRALGGGCELSMLGDSAVAHMELYIGLIEVGVGLIPGGTGCKELLRRIVNPVMRIPNADPLPPLMQLITTIGMAKVSGSALEAKKLGYLREHDRIIMNKDSLIPEAKREALHLYHRGYIPPKPEKIYAAGRDVLAALTSGLYQMSAGNFISKYDHHIVERLARILCGGDITLPTWVDEQHILDLERETIVHLFQQPKTMERIMHMLQTKKPLRN